MTDRVEPAKNGRELGALAWLFSKLGTVTFAPFGLPFGLLTLSSADAGAWGIFLSLLKTEDWVGALRQRLRAFGLLALRVRRTF